MTSQEAIFYSIKKLQLSETTEIQDLCRSTLKSKQHSKEQKNKLCGSYSVYCVKTCHMHKISMTDGELFQVVPTVVIHTLCAGMRLMRIVSSSSWVTPSPSIMMELIRSSMCICTFWLWLLLKKQKTKKNNSSTFWFQLKSHYTLGNEY